MSDPRVIVVTKDVPRVVTVAARGPQGPTGAEAAISTDPNNRAVPGTDGGIFVPDGGGVDPVAWYILAKN